MKMMMEDELRDCTLLVLCNKQDLPNAMTRNVYLLFPFLLFSFFFFFVIFLSSSIGERSRRGPLLFFALFPLITPIPLSSTGSCRQNGIEQSQKSNLGCF